MARRRLRLDRVGLLLLGTALGFVVSVVFVYLYIQQARTRVVEERVRIALGLPAEAFTLERIEPDGTLQIALHQIAFLDRNRDTILSAPLARARLVTASLGGGPIVFDQGEVLRPFLRLQRQPNGDWNALQIFAVEAAGKPVNGAGGKARGNTFDFRSLRLVEGRVRMVNPTTPPAAGAQPAYVPGRTPEKVRVGGRWLAVHTVENLNATLALVRIKGEGGWRVEMQSATARVSNPDTRIEALAGWLDQDAGDNLRFSLRELRTPHSSFDGEGRMVLGAAPRYDLRLRAHPLDFRDLAGMGFALPREGSARFSLALQTLDRQRTRWTLSDAHFAVLDSRASGHLTAITAPGADPVFSDTRLRLEPLRLTDLEALGFVQHLPVAGEVTGTIASLDEVQAGGGALRVDLDANLVPRTSSDAPPSVLAARGVVRFGRGGMAFDGLRVDAQPLNLATLAAAYPQQAALLRGVVRGGATLNGTLQALRVSGGDLAWSVGGAPETRLRGIRGTLAMNAGPRFDFEARADPLALATLSQLFPSLPFRSATLAGPIHLSGTPAQVAFSADLNGSAGGIAARGTLALDGPVPRFDVSGRLTAFRAGVLVAGAPPAADSVSGTFSARGSTQDFRFGVDLSQTGGRFNLAGTLRRPGGGPAELDVSGRVENFQLGVLLGRPSLLPGRVSGPVRIFGGGRQPYRFDVDLRGPLGQLTLNGSWASGTTPVYAVNGEVAGLDLSALPGMGMLPHTRLTGTLRLNGRGTTTETFVGELQFRAAPGTTLGGIALTHGVLSVRSAGGVLQVDSLLFTGRGFRAEASGSMGLTRNAGPLSFALTAPDLAQLRPFVPGSDTLPAIEGSVSLTGTATGTVRQPALGMSGQARGFRYGAYAADALGFTFAGARGGSGWTGRTTLNGSALQVRAIKLLALDANVDLQPGNAGFSFSARRDPETDLTAAGRLELEGLAPRGALLDALTLRIGGGEWRLAQRSHLAWGGERGVVVDNLLLRRSGTGAPGVIEANGVLPPRGVADFRLRLEGIDLAEARRVFPSLPDASGMLRLSAELKGQVNDPRFTLNARVDSLRMGGVTADSLHLTASYASSSMAVTAGVRVGGREVVDASATLPVRLSLGGVVPGFELLREQPLRARVLADSVPLALLTQLFPLYVKDGAGVARARVEIGGTPAHPSVAGEARVENGALTPVKLGALWHDINGRLSMHGDTIRVDSLTAISGRDGRAFVNGMVLVDDGTRPLVDLALSLHDFQVADNSELAKIQADAAVRLSGRVPAVLVTGSVRLVDGTLYIPSLNDTREADIVDADVGALGADSMSVPSASAQILGALVPRDLRVTVGESVWLQSADAHIQIAGELVIDRPAQTNLIFGELDAVRGTYTLEFGPIRRQFEIVQGVVRFYGTPELNPSLDITASNEVRGNADQQPVVVLVHLAGTMQQPRVELTTNNRQPLSQSELASLLLFGRTGASGGAVPEELLSGLVLQEAVANLLAAQLESQLVRNGILDFVRVRTRAATGAGGAGTGATAFGLLGAVTIEAGKEVISNLYLTGEVVDLFSTQPQFGVGIDWQISRTLSLRAAAEPVQRDPLVRNLFRVHRQVTVDLRRRWEYGRPRARPHPQPRRDPEQNEPATPAAPPGQATPPPPTPRDEIEGPP